MSNSNYAEGEFELEVMDFFNGYCNLYKSYTLPSSELLYYIQEVMDVDVKYMANLSFEINKYKTVEESITCTRITYHIPHVRALISMILYLNKILTNNDYNFYRLGYDSEKYIGAIYKDYNSACYDSDFPIPNNDIKDKLLMIDPELQLIKSDLPGSPLFNGCIMFIPKMVSDPDITHMYIEFTLGFDVIIEMDNITTSDNNINSIKFKCKYDNFDDSEDE